MSMRRLPFRQGEKNSSSGIADNAAQYSDKVRHQSTLATRRLITALCAALSVAGLYYVLLPQLDSELPPEQDKVHNNLRKRSGVHNDDPCT